MRANCIALLGVLSYVGCDSKLVPNDGYNGPDISCPPNTVTCPSNDMATTPPAPKCLAAAGLAGDNLLCVNFSAINDMVLTAPLPQLVSNWTFSKDSKNADCWQVKGGKLQIINFNGSFMDSCKAALPSMDFINDVNLKPKNYKKVILSLVQQVDLELGVSPNAPNQLAQIYNGNTSNPAFLLTQTSGKQPEQQVTFTIDITNLPPAGTNVANYIIQVTSSFKQFKDGLQISSIAVNAIQ